MITRWILPHLPARTGGRRAAADPAELVSAICYKLKTGCQWRWLPVKESIKKGGAIQICRQPQLKSGLWTLHPELDCPTLFDALLLADA